ncbi:MAG: hypothetical protein KDE56_19615, partial [Anaerolineales bacterium]|nr:hypothetical protein [Anaerolineales bacterium]
MSASKMYSTYRPKERNWPAFANAKPLRLPMGEKLQNWLQSGTVFNVTLYLSAALFVALVLLVPLYLFIRTGTAWAKAVETLLRPATLQVLGNTVLLSVSVTL